MGLKKPLLSFRFCMTNSKFGLFSLTDLYLFSRSPQHLAVETQNCVVLGNVLWCSLSWSRVNSLCLLTEYTRSQNTFFGLDICQKNRPGCGSEKLWFRPDITFVVDWALKVISIHIWPKEYGISQTPKCKICPTSFNGLDWPNVKVTCTVEKKKINGNCVFLRLRAHEPNCFVGQLDCWIRTQNSTQQYFRILDLHVNLSQRLMVFCYAHSGTGLPNWARQRHCT